MPLARGLSATGPQHWPRARAWSESESEDSPGGSPLPGSPRDAPRAAGRVTSRVTVTSHGLSLSGSTSWHSNPFLIDKRQQGESTGNKTLPPVAAARSPGLPVFDHLHQLNKNVGRAIRLGFVDSKKSM